MPTINANQARPNVQYDLIVLGAGAAGSTAAATAAAQGAHVALVERDQLGGTCLNYGCDPTKTLLAIAHRLYQARHSAPYGLFIPTVTVDWQQVQSYVRQVIQRIRGGTPEEAVQGLHEQGIDVISGTAHFISPYEVQVQETTYSAPRVILATGNQTVIPAIEGLSEAGFLTNREAVSLPSLPRRLAILGGGAIGIEFAQLFQRFGVQVSVLEQSAHLLEKEDRELANELCRLLRQEGISLQSEVQLLRVSSTPSGKKLLLQHKDGQQSELEVDEILLALGRRPALTELALEKAGVVSMASGVPVDQTLRTNVPHIWAAGDVLGGLQFTHLAYEQGRLAAQNAFANQPQPFGERIIPWVTYTDPPLAHVGKTEEELREKQAIYRVGHISFNEIERAITSGETMGQVKLFVDEAGLILGGQILGQRADDLLAPLVLAMQLKLSAEQLAATILPYPTRSQAIRWVSDHVKGSLDFESSI
ncbi:dihydrolipoyl dehydrogenase family protein [Tengunoibacter tsumagoiensis]|uniref:Mercuric reductase n=1 Tax=Tengunoibacter tsumagoiensis TaxID=2014871 RepID=A0A402A4I1_9CHLR|nr:FAD-dependent oxidoreductase [Tengunoibacter tsumagoiensis]GCE13966.1 mercuric reductase [Tengunoibacter tsumagoiensis]